MTLESWMGKHGINLDWEAKATLKEAVDEYVAQKTEVLEKEIAELKGQVSERPAKTLYSESSIRELIGDALGKAQACILANDAESATDYARLAQTLAALL